LNSIREALKPLAMTLVHHWIGQGARLAISRRWTPHPEIPMCFTGIASPFGILRHSEFSLNVAFFVRHQKRPSPKTG
jgi:hypothetical protein